MRKYRLSLLDHASAQLSNPGALVAWLDHRFVFHRSSYALPRDQQPRLSLNRFVSKALLEQRRSCITLP